MRKVATIMALGLLTLAGIAQAAKSPVADEPSPGGTFSGAGLRSNDCPNQIIFDVGMTDDFTPPAGCSSAGSVDCWEQAQGNQNYILNLADEFPTNGETITGFKFWARYNQQGYDSGLRTHGFCIDIYDAPDPIFCPDGSGSASDIGTLISSQYCGTGSFVEHEITGFLPRNFNYCVTLPVQVPTIAGHEYWVAIASDYDYVTFNGATTRHFLRFTNQGSGFTACEAVLGFCDVTDPNNPICDPWCPISAPCAFNLPCWAGWDLGLVVYGIPGLSTGACCYQDGSCSITTQADCYGSYQGDHSTCDPNPCPQPPVLGACCFVDGSCAVLTAADCEANNGQYYGDNTVCDPNPCPPPVPTRTSTWGNVKHQLGK